MDVVEALRLGPYVRGGALTRATMDRAADEIEALRRHLERAQGAEADLAALLVRAERAEADVARLQAALRD